MYFSKIFFFIFECLAQLKILVKPKMIFKLTQKKRKKEEEEEEEEEESLHKGVNCFMPLRKHKNIYTSPEATPPSIKLHKPKVETLAPPLYCQHHYSLPSSSLTNQRSNP